MSVALAVVGLVLFIVLVQLAIWVPLILRWRRRSAAYWSAFDDEVTRTGEATLIPRQSAIYRGSTGSKSQVRGNGQIVLTAQRLLFRKATGGVVEVPTAQIAGVHRSKGFNGSIVGGHEHLVVELADRSEVAYFVTDTDFWAAQLEQLGTR
jgi:hypothetical protein